MVVTIKYIGEKGTNKWTCLVRNKTSAAAVIVAINEYPYKDEYPIESIKVLQVDKEYR